MTAPATLSQSVFASGGVSPCRMWQPPRPMRTSADTTTNYSAPLAFSAAFKFACENLRKIIVVSALLVIPCIWHKHIQAGDLGSHVYNTWLAQLAEKGQGPGIVVVRQWNNVFFDISLDYAARLFGWHAAERLLV